MDILLKLSILIITAFALKYPVRWFLKSKYKLNDSELDDLMNDCARNNLNNL